MNNIKNENIYCTFSLIGAAFISGLSFVAQKLGMNYVEPLTFNTLRYLLGLAFLFPILCICEHNFKKTQKVSARTTIKGGLFCGIVLFLAFTINQYAMIDAPAGKAGFIVSLYIIFVPLISTLLGGKLHTNVRKSIVIALVGLYLLCYNSENNISKNDIILLISSIFFAIHIMVASHYSKIINPIKLTFMQFLFAFILSLPLTLLIETPQMSTIILGYKPLLFIGIIVTGVAYTLQIIGHVATNQVIASIILSSEAVFAVLGGKLILDEVMTTRQILGCIIMAVALILAQITDNKKRRKNMETEILNQTFEEERALYNLKNTRVLNCKFGGPQDGESVLKECRDIEVGNSTFSLRYPIWHAIKFNIINSYMDDKTRAPLWYAKDGIIQHCKIEGIKCLRECENILVQSSNIISPEFGWKCKGLKIEDSQIDSMYFLFESNNVEIKNLKMTGKYSFQYMNNLHIKDSILDTKDAFWHSKNITVENSIVKGEYLAWFSENLTLVNCKIIGTQPFCYCKNLKLENCTMEDTDLAFEYSDVEADIKGHVLSIKNPKSGTITLDSVGEIIKEDEVVDCQGIIVQRKVLV